MVTRRLKSVSVSMLVMDGFSATSSRDSDCGMKLHENNDMGEGGEHGSMDRDTFPGALGAGGETAGDSSHFGVRVEENGVES